MYGPSTQVGELGLREVKKPPQVLIVGRGQTQDLNKGLPKSKDSILLLPLQATRIFPVLQRGKRPSG